MELLRATAIGMFVLAVVMVFVQPPTFSGVGGLVTLAVGSVALILVTAWATIALSGDDGMTDREFERLVRRSEELAREPRLARQATEFELAVAEAIDRLPDEFKRLLEDTPVVVSQRGAEVSAYGHYFGDTVASGNYEDRIVLYQDTLERDFGYDPEVLGAQIERTLRHELAHHLGWREPGVRELGL